VKKITQSKNKEREQGLFMVENTSTGRLELACCLFEMLGSASVMFQTRHRCRITMALTAVSSEIK